MWLQTQNRTTRFAVANLAAALAFLPAFAGCDSNPDGPAVPRGAALRGESESSAAPSHSNAKVKKPNRRETKQSTPGPRTHG